MPVLLKCCKHLIGYRKRTWGTGFPFQILLGEGDSTRLLYSTGAEWEFGRFMQLLPPSVASALVNHSSKSTTTEAVLELGRTPKVFFQGSHESLRKEPVTADELKMASKSLKFRSDNRAGVNGTLHRVCCSRNLEGQIIGLRFRVGRAVEGSARLVYKEMQDKKSILFLGRPGIGKTTVIRDVARFMSTELDQRVMIVDRSNEIAGDGDVPHACIGQSGRLQVPHSSSQYAVMLEALQNHTPEVIIVDEVSGSSEVNACKTIGERGVQLVATAHGGTLEDAMNNPQLWPLLGEISPVVLGDEEARSRAVSGVTPSKWVRQRKLKPTFDVVVEMGKRLEWIVHSTEASVDAILQGKPPTVQVRTWEKSKGCVVITLCSKENGDNSHHTREAPDVNGTSLNAVTKGKSFLHGKPPVGAERDNKNPATTFTSQLVRQAQKATPHHSPAYNLLEQFPALPSAHGIAVKFALRDVVEAKLKTRKGNHKQYVDLVQETTDALFEGLLGCVESYLKYPERVKEWKEPPLFNTNQLLTLASRTKELIESKFRSEGMQLESSLAEKGAGLLINGVLTKLGSLPAAPDSFELTMDVIHLSRSKINAGEALQDSDAYQLLVEPVRDMLRKMITDKGVDVDKLLVNNLVDTISNFGTAIVHAVIESPRVLGHVGTSAVISNPTHEPLVLGFEAILRNSFGKSSRTSKQFKIAAQKLTQELLSEFRPSIESLLMNVPSDANELIKKITENLVKDKLKENLIVVDENTFRDVVKEIRNFSAAKLRAYRLSPRAFGRSTKTQKVLTVDHALLVYGLEILLRQGLEESDWKTSSNAQSTPAGISVSPEQFRNAAERVAWSIRCRSGAMVGGLHKYKRQQSEETTELLDVTQLIREPVACMVQDMVMNKDLDADENTINDIIEEIYNACMVSVETCMTSSEAVMNRSRPPPAPNSVVEPLVHGFEAMLRGSHQGSAMGSEQIRATAEQLAWTSRSELGQKVRALQNHQELLHKFK